MKKNAIGGFVICCLLAALPDHVSAAPEGNGKFVWFNSAYNDEGNKGRYTARLTYQVPETDNVQFDALCAAGSSGTEIQVTIGYDVEGHNDGDEIKLKVEAGDYKAMHSAEIYGTQLEVGVSGALLYVEPGDPFWQALAAGTGVMTYKVAGGPAASMELKDSIKPVNDFVGDCRAIYDAQK